MIAEANTMFLKVMDFAKANPIIASAAGLWGLSVVTFLCRDIPSRIVDFIIYQSTTTLELNSQDEIYFQFLNWISENKLHSFVRTLNLNNGKTNRYGDFQASKGLNIGYGRMFFFHEKRLFIIYRNKDSANQTEKVKETLTLRALGRNQKVFSKLFDMIVSKNKEDTRFTKIYTYGDGHWYSNVRQHKRDISTIAINEQIERTLFHGIDSFIANKPWYVKNGVPYRYGILLQGPPGTGKTSLIKAICAKYNRSLYLLNLGQMTDKTLLEALSEVPEGGLVAIEDIDAQGVDTTRDNDEDDKAPKLKFLTISGILNALDGVASSEDRILIATTNHPEKLDSAIIRPGRIDLQLTIGNMETPAFTRYMSRMYSDFVLPEGYKLPDGISPARVQQLVFENKNDWKPVLEALK